MQGKVIDAQTKQRFLQKLYSSAGNVTKAAKAAGLSRGAAYGYKKSDADFSAAWDGIIDQVVDVMEEELYRRSVRGVLEPVFYKGQLIAKVRKYSDRLLEFALKAKKPEVYRERFEVNQRIAGQLDVNLVTVIDEVYGSLNEDLINAENSISK